MTMCTQAVSPSDSNRLDTGSGNVEPLVDTALLPAGSAGQEIVSTAHRIYEHLISLWAPGIIETSFDLGIFDELAKGPATSQEVAQALGTNSKATRVLLDGLRAYRLLETSSNEHGALVYVLPDSVRACMLPDGLFSLAGKIKYDRLMAWGAWRDLGATVRAGTVDENGYQKSNQISDKEYESLVRGINFWAPPVVEILAKHLRVLGWPRGERPRMLDVGCGTGIYSQLLLREFASLTALGIDVGRILPLAAEQSKQIGLVDRFTATEMDFLQDDWGSGFELVLFVNIFHLQTPADAQDLMVKANKAMADGGVVAIVDQIIDDEADQDRQQDRFFRLFAASMMATGGGDAYTLAQYDQWLADSGLRRIAVADTPMHRILFASRS
jgi:predicted TPR repeat methyltransferase